MKKHWRDLSHAERVTITAMAGAQVALATAAWVDLYRRPSAAVRGSKPLWAAAIAVNFVGPLSYFAFGRRVPSATVNALARSTAIAGTHTTRSATDGLAALTTSPMAL